MTDFILLADWKQWIIGPAMFFVALFLILLVLVQRGRGGGLAGALGGPGGQSAFGTKAGDVFTKITVSIAAIWILLCVLGVAALQNPSGQNDKFDGDSFSPTINLDQNNTEGEGPGISAPPTETETAPAATSGEAESKPEETTSEPAE